MEILSMVQSVNLPGAAWLRVLMRVVMRVAMRALSALKSLLPLTIFLAAAAPAGAAMQPPPENGLIVLCYHEVGDRRAGKGLAAVKGQAPAPLDALHSIDVSALVAQLGWLRDC
jgi:hypothetical protein